MEELRARMIDRIIRPETRREEEMRGEEKRRRQNTRVAFHTLFGALVYSERVRARARARALRYQTSYTHCRLYLLFYSRHSSSPELFRGQLDLSTQKSIYLN